MPPLTCPPLRDCPLYDQRAISADERLRRLVLAERHRYPNLAALVRAEAAQHGPAEAEQTAGQPARLAPAPGPSQFVFPKSQKGATNG